MELIKKKTTAGTLYYENESGEVVQKQCTDCKHVKPLSEFTAHNIGIAGRSYECQDCYKKRKKKYRQSLNGRVKTAYYNVKAGVKEVEEELGIKVPDNLQLYDIAFIQGYDECSYCGKELEPGAVTIDHVKPFRSGGTNDFSNLLSSCKSCNSRKGDKPLYTFLMEHVDDYYKRRVLFTLAQRQLKDIPTLLQELKEEQITMKKLTLEDLKNYYPGASYDGEEWGYPYIEVVTTYTHKETGKELLIDSETLEVLQVINDDDYEPNIFIREIHE